VFNPDVTVITLLWKEKPWCHSWSKLISLKFATDTRR